MNDTTNPATTGTTGSATTDTTDATSTATTIREGEVTTYLSARSCRGWPYLAESKLVAYRTKDGRLVWRPRGPIHFPNQHGVPSNWYREGTARAVEAKERFAGGPRPWDEIVNEGGKES